MSGPIPAILNTTEIAAKIARHEYLCIVEFLVAGKKTLSQLLLISFLERRKIEHEEHKREGTDSFCSEFLFIQTLTECKL